MKRRVRKIANFFAFNLLFFALYLNFIHKDKIAIANDTAAQQRTAAFSGTVLVDNPEKFADKKNTTAIVSEQPSENAPERIETGAPLKLSIN